MLPTLLLFLFYYFACGLQMPLLNHRIKPDRWIQIIVPNLSKLGIGRPISLNTLIINPTLSTFAPAENCSSHLSSQYWTGTSDNPLMHRLSCEHSQ